ncbi:MAG: CDP-alcohol phosphatidyltransferase family protein [Gemmatimonadota bacterium]|nr:MAG: CDP-alcohol phosphatidyltransferase family protein [Gemmatimonadota bacterium]
MLPQKLKEWFRNLLKPIGTLCTRLGIHPHVLTITGLVISCSAGFTFGLGFFRWAGLFVIISGIFDMLDGHTARISGKKSSFGALFDSTIDRYAELVVFIGLAIYYMNHPHPALIIIILLAISGSMMVSYVKARAEGLNMECTIGLMQRPERIVYLGFGAMIFGNTILFQIILGVIAVFTNVTAVQRVYYIYVRNRKQCKATEKENCETKEEECL